MGSSKLPDSGWRKHYVSPGCDVSEDVELQLRYYLRSSVPRSSPHHAAFESCLDAIEEKRSANQLQHQLQFSKHAAEAVRRSSQVASIFAAAVFLLEFANIVQLIHAW